MLNLNDDMDDLIRQAADDYPLKIEGKDWDKVLGAMQSAATVRPVNNKKYWWLLLLLLPLIVAIPFTNKNEDAQRPAEYSNTKKTDVPAEKQNVDGAVNKNNEPVSKENKATTQGTASNIPAAQMQEKTSEEQQHELQQRDRFDIKTTAATNNRAKVATSVINSNNGKQMIPETSSNKSNNNNTISNSTILNRNVTAGNSYKNSVENNKSQAANSGITASEQTNKNTIDKETTSATADSSNTNKIAGTPQKESAATTKKMALKHTTPIKTKGLYAGVAAGLDVTTVKFQKVDKIGYTTSLIIGYRINNNWSLESGLMWDNKNYFSTGEYFNKKNAGLTPDYRVHFLNGTCSMFEIPLNIKYDFRSRQLSGFFVTAGLSSYIMKKESYTGFITHNAEPIDSGYYKELVYKNATNNLFSVVNISGGYQFIFKNNSSLRIEPYLKVPLSGLGIGKLPFSSAGISAAYTLPIH